MQPLRPITLGAGIGPGKHCDDAGGKDDTCRPAWQKAQGVLVCMTPHNQNNKHSIGCTIEKGKNVKACSTTGICHGECSPARNQCNEAIRKNYAKR